MATCWNGSFLQREGSDYKLPQAQLIKFSHDSKSLEVLLQPARPYKRKLDNHHELLILYIILETPSYSFKELRPV